MAVFQGAKKTEPTAPVNVLTIGKAAIWAGPAHLFEGQHFPLTILIRNETDEWGAYIPPMAAFQMNETAKEILPSLIPPKPLGLVKIYWPDMGLPDVRVRFWFDLVAALREAGDISVALYCNGGRGRTGAALAILASLAGLIPAGADPIVWVRQNYHPTAVETSAQVRYVEIVTGYSSRALGSTEVVWNPKSQGANSSKPQSTSSAAAHQGDPVEHVDYVRGKKGGWIRKSRGKTA